MARAQRTQNVADLQAQVASCQRGANELAKMVAQFGLATVRAYMGHVQDNAEESVRRVLDVLQDGEFTYAHDAGPVVKVKISIDKEARRATVDFTGTSSQQPWNFNAPAAVTRAAVLYVFRTLVDDDIPMNEGCLKPIEIVLPEGSVVCCHHPAAVCAGNVETSQWVTDTLYGALGVLAAAQGTMNNFTFGNARYQYYETICGGSGAGPDFDGTAAVHTHMTNSRLTDPEVFEWRYPVLLESHRINRGSGGKGSTRAATARSAASASSSPCRRRWSRTIARCPLSVCAAAAPARSATSGSSAPTAAASRWRAVAGPSWVPATCSPFRHRAAGVMAGRRTDDTAN